jgi:hypothetical protein
MTPILENLERTFADIKQIDPAKGRKVMTNYDDFINKYQLVVKVKSVGSLLKKARQYYFNENKIREMNLLFSTYCEIKANNLSNEDLRAANLADYITGNNLTLEEVEQRLTALGWKKIKR